MTQSNFFTGGQATPAGGQQGQVYTQQGIRALPSPDPSTLVPSYMQSGGVGQPAVTAPPLLTSGAPQGQSEQPGQYPPGYLPRIIEYKGQEYQDPGPKWTAQGILDWMAEKHFPELQGGSYRSEVGPDGTETIHLYKVGAMKGKEDSGLGG